MLGTGDVAMLKTRSQVVLEVLKVLNFPTGFGAEPESSHYLEKPLEQETTHAKVKVSSNS